MFSPSPLRRTLAAALRDLGATKATVRESAARDLAMVGTDSPRASADAVAVLLDDSETAVRVAALDALASLDAQHLVQRITACFDDQDSRVRQSAVIAVGTIRTTVALDALRAALEHRLADVRYQALLGVVERAPAIGAEAARTALDTDDVWIASEAAEQLGRLIAAPPEAWPASRRALALEALAARSGDPRPRVSLSASLALLRAGDPRGEPIAIEYVSGGLDLGDEPSDEVLCDAIELLGDSGVGGDPSRVTEALGRHAWRPRASAVRGLARAALARRGDQHAAEALIAQLESVWPARREEAVALVAKSRLTNAVTALARLASKGGATGTAAVNALATVGTDRALGALESLEKSRHRDVREAATAAVNALREELLNATGAARRNV